MTPTPTVTIRGGMPIYQNGLANLLHHLVPGARIRSVPVLGGNVGAGDLDLIILGRKPDLKLLDAVPASPEPRGHLLIGGLVSRTGYEQLCAREYHNYLLHTAAVDRFRYAVTSVLHGDRYLDPALEASWNRSAGLPRSLSLPEPLTRRERQVLDLIVQECTTGEIAGKLFIGNCTVETHRAHILQKLGVRNTAGIVREAMRRELCTV